MQNDLIHLGGWFVKHGVDISRMRAIISNIKRLIEHAREKRVAVIYTRMIFRKDLVGAGLILEIRPIYRKGALREGTWGANIVDELAQEESDFVVDKTRYSAFIGTNLEILLGGLKTDVLFVTGVATNSCVEATAKDAFQRDFRVVLVKDCTATISDEFQKMAEKAIEFGYGQVLRLEEVLKLF